MQSLKRKVNHVLVFTLACIVFLFAIYLKVLPSSQIAPPTGVSTHVKIWADPHDSLDTKLKVVPAMVLAILFFVIGFTVVKASRTVLVAPSVVIPHRDLFVRQQHWFRPPPLS